MLVLVAPLVLLCTRGRRLSHRLPKAAALSTASGAACSLWGALAVWLFYDQLIEHELALLFIFPVLILTEAGVAVAQTEPGRTLIRFLAAAAGATLGYWVWIGLLPPSRHSAC